MYIEYVRNQVEAGRMDGRLCPKANLNGPRSRYSAFSRFKMILSLLPRLAKVYKDHEKKKSVYEGLRRQSGFFVPKFKPTWLVRVSDMQVVRGASVDGHYWALSYSWNQSGKLVHQGGEEYERIDQGQHQITEYRRIPGNTTETSWGPSTRVMTDTDFDPETASTKFVTFEGLVQQICKDFGIKYIWYDQMCINQDDQEEKLREIKQMHLVYKNARCTVVLVPELQCTLENGIINNNACIEEIPNSEWCRRMWTLQEAYVSEHILFLGRNVHIWADIDHIWETALVYGYPPLRSRKYSNERKWMACTVLWYARSRTSRKAHDRIFALANIFPALMDGVTFGYDQPLPNLMFQFYHDLARKDISILLFGAPIHPNLKDELLAIRQKEASFLPSWTGANGAHITEFMLGDEPVIVTADYTISGNCMRITSTFATARLEAVSEVKMPDDFRNPEKYDTRWDCLEPVHDSNFVECYETRDEYQYRFSDDGLPLNGLWMGYTYTLYKDIAYLTFVTTTSKPHPSYNKVTLPFGLKVTHIFPLITEEESKTATNTLSRPTYCGGFLSLTEECSECIILFEPCFREYYLYFIYPVIKKEKDCYKSIGVCIFHKHLILASMVQPKQTFDIK
ncbi:hypothetical protein BJV82DRAFT_713694 [Fennellomyces sp. T-0311]|nr:hypothetical protein BJV82DRAFT_713694 [Fennellomyces sp. T-0311]